MLVELSMAEQRYDAVRKVLDGATVTDTATRFGSIAGRFIAGWCATRTRASAPLPIAVPSRTAAHTRWHPKSKP